MQCPKVPCPICFRNLVSGPPGVRGREVQVEHDSDSGAPAEGLVELRECGSHPSFLVIAHSSCNHFFASLTQGQRLADKLSPSLCEGACSQLPPNTGDSFPPEVPQLRQNRSNLLCTWGHSGAGEVVFAIPKGMVMVGGPKPPEHVDESLCGMLFGVPQLAISE